MPALANPRHEKFAQAVASGKSASEAYRQSGANGKNADVNAARLLVNDGIRERVAELKDAQSQKSELSRDGATAISYRSDFDRLPAKSIEHSKLCQSYKVTPEVAAKSECPTSFAPSSNWPSCAVGMRLSGTSMVPAMS